MLDHGVQSWLLGLRYDPSAYEEAALRATAAGGGMISSGMADFMRTKFLDPPSSPCLPMLSAGSDGSREQVSVCFVDVLAHIAWRKF